MRNHSETAFQTYQTPSSHVPAPRQFRRNEQRGIFANTGPGISSRREYVRGITDRHFALRAGLPAPETIAPEYRDLGSRELPIYHNRRDLVTMVHRNRVSMLEGETGSGKTSQLWQYLLGEGYDLTVVLVPRKVIAENVYERAREELTEQRGAELADTTIGIMHSDRVERHENDKVVFMTAGTFTKIFPSIEEEYADRPIAIISDEVHEADLPVELATAIAAQSLDDHEKWRLVLSSATQNKEKVQAALGPVNGGEVPVVSVEGRPNNITFIEEPHLTVIQAYMKYRRHQMVAENEMGSEQEEVEPGPLREKAMIFQPGKADTKEVISDIYKQLGRAEGRRDGGTRGFRPAVLHSKITQAAMQQIMAETLPGEHVVIASTSAGQSGITIPKLSLVITDGRTKRSELDSEGTSGLFIRDAAQAEITQQGGRAGRDIENGLCVLTKAESVIGEPYFKSFEEREKHAPAQIHQTNIMRTVLSVVALGRDFTKLNEYLLSPVDDEQTILEALEGLYRLGAIDEDNQVTELGHLMDMFPLRPELSRGVVEAWKGGHSLQTIANVTAVASAIEAGGMASFEDGVGTAWKKLLRSTTADDCIAQLDMFQTTRSSYYGRAVDEELLLSQDIDPKNAYRAHRQWDKCLRAMDLSPHDIILLPPDEAGEHEVRDILLAGMVDYVYQKTGVVGRNNDAMYHNVHNLSTDMGRLMSSRSMVEGNEDAPLYAAGFPRRYPIVKKVRADKKTKEPGAPKFVKQADIAHVLESAWPLSSESLRKLAHYAGHLIRDEAVRQHLNSEGRLEEVRRRRLGSIVLSDTQRLSTQRPSKEGRSLLVEAALEGRNNDVQRALRQLIYTLGEIRDRVPKGQLDDYFDRTDLPDLSMLRTWTQEAARYAHSVGEVNANLRTRLYQDDGLRRESWISDEAVAEIYTNAPSQIEGKDGRVFSLGYDNGQPIINHMKLAHIDQLPSPCQLADGREILFHIDSTDKRDRQLYDLNDLLTMRGDFDK